jgi:hypothetical protein
VYPVVAIKAKKVTSMKQLRQTLNRGNRMLTRIPKYDRDMPFDVRFLAEVDSGEWVEYEEHFDDKLKYFPCSEDCIGCDEGMDRTTRFLAPALVRDDDKVVPLVVPGSLVDSLADMAEQFDGTITDRDYRLIRKGAGKEGTKYSCLPLDETRVRLDRYKVPNLTAVLRQQLPGAVDEDDDEDEAPPPRRKVSPPSIARRSNGGRTASASRTLSTRKASPARRRDDDNGDDESPRRSRTVGKPLRKLR